MAKHAPRKDAGESDLEVGDRKTHAAGVPAVLHALKMSQAADGGAAHGAHAGPAQPAGRASTAPAAPGPTPTTRTPLEFCENGAKAVAEEATAAPGRPRLLRRAPGRRAGRRRPTTGSGQQGRLTEPMHKPAGARPLRADRLGRARSPLIAERLHGAAHPGRARRSTPRAAPATRRRSSTSCSCARFGTNNLPDCSNMCHESSGAALGADDRHRQGHGPARGHRRRRPDPGRRPEPRHQPPADADRAGAGQAQRRQDRRDQPAPRGRAARGSRTRRRPDGPGQGHRPRRRLPPGPARRRPGAVRGARRS